jgi:hypothetical protein
MINGQIVEAVCHAAFRRLLSLALVAAFSPSGVAAQLTFQKALDLSVQQRSVHVTAGCSEVPRSDLQIAAGPGLGDAPEDFLTLSDTSSSVSGPNIQHLRPKPAQPSQSALAQPNASIRLDEGQSRSAIRCAAVAFVELAKVDLEISTLRGQQKAAERLVSIESRRVVARVDNPAALMRAKLFAARTKMWTAELDDAALRLREELADLTGLPEEQIELVDDTIPPWPHVSTTDPELEAIMNQSAASRDVAQLEFALARIQRMSTNGKMVIGKAKWSDLVTAYTIEEEKFIGLVQASFDSLREQVQLLELTGGLEEWASDTASGSRLSSRRAPVKDNGEPLTLPISETVKPKPKVRSILISPSVSALVTGQSQQFSAIAIYADGNAKNVTAEAAWRCSSNSRAVLSSSGLMTALGTGPVTISATISGSSQSRLISIAEDTEKPF